MRDEIAIFSFNEPAFKVIFAQRYGAEKKTKIALASKNVYKNKFGVFDWRRFQIQSKSYVDS